MSWSPPTDKLWYPKANRRPLPSRCIVGGFSSKPLGVLDHFTAGCGDPFGTLAGEGYAVAFYVATDGTVEQYHATNVWGWHARQASSVYYGIEHECYPTRCDLTEAQLDASAALNAWLFGEVLAYMPEQFRRSKGQRFTIGVKSHNDGLEDANNWDDAHHWDGIWKADADWLDGGTRAALNRSPWTSATYISKVKAYMRGGGEDDVALTEDQVATLGALKGQRDGWRDFLEGKDPDTTRSEDYAFGYNMASLSMGSNVRYDPQKKKKTTV